MKRSVVIISKKNHGGDRNASLLLQDYFNKKNITSVLKDEIDFNFNEDIKYLFIGQSIVSEFISQYKNNISSSRNIFIYSHIISPEILSFIENYKNINLIITESEYRIHKEKISKINNVIQIPLALPTYLKNDAKKLYQEHQSSVDKIVNNSIIHLGGSYKNVKNEDIIINDFMNIKRELNTRNHEKISIITHPRTFKDIINNPLLIAKRFLEISGRDRIKNTYFFVSKDIYKITMDNKRLFSKFNIYISPPYNAILYYLNEIGTENEQYISADQYNAFADIKMKVYGFLLNENDLNQSEYLKTYETLENNRDLLKQFLKVLNNKNFNE